MNLRLRGRRGPLTGAGAAALTAAAVFLAPAAAAAPADDVRDAVEAVQEQARQAVEEAEQALRDAQREAEQAAGSSDARAQREAEQAVEEAEQALDDAQQEAEQAADDVTDQAQQEAEQAVEEAEQALDDAQQEAEQAAENGSARAQQEAEQAVEEAEQALDDARQQARQALEEAQQAAGDVQRQAEDALGNLPTFQFGDWMPRQFLQNLDDLRDTPASERAEELQDMVEDALRGDYGARTENLTERFGGMLASLPPDLRSDIEEVLGKEPQQARADVRQIMEDAVDGEYGPEVEELADWLRETSQRWDLAGAIQGTGGAAKDSTD
ncbi:hypothetical protein [Blastococcus sp. VKM Ac-2987]|uniref:hypothetical protein n=1 Tax=Blastococcus sp. VKM Ac-2987 TaxID=3004141 RepID=UPI0022AB99A2|nr:hypothetical protein [Blastococcus sp. VKM Ac-2987]MCZ2860914.1 hypothetical protein [Blastococcus sp. VKM Ac-2987]